MARQASELPAETAGEAALTTTDEVARAVIERASPIRFETAKTDEDRRAVYRLRYEVVIERAWVKPEDIPDGLERDEYDRSAIHILGWNGGTLVATARVVFPAAGQRLPTEDVFDIQIEPRGRVADMSRQIARPLDGQAPHRIFAGLLGTTWLEIRRRGYALISGDFSSAMMRLYRMVGFDVTQLGPGREFWGELRYPILVDPTKVATKLRDMWG